MEDEELNFCSKRFSNFLLAWVRDRLFTTASTASKTTAITLLATVDGLQEVSKEETLAGSENLVCVVIRTQKTMY